MTLRRNAKIEAAPLKDELLLFNPATNKFFVMNASAAFLWERLGQPMSQEALADAMCAAFSGLGSEQALADVGKTVKTMIELELLIEEGASAPAA